MQADAAKRLAAAGNVDTPEQNRRATMTVVPRAAEPVPMSEEQKFLFDLNSVRSG